MKTRGISRALLAAALALTPFGVAGAATILVDSDGDDGTGCTSREAGDCRSVNLRAERQGPGNGRVYTIHLAATDASGNTGTASFQVLVPHDQFAGAVDDCPAYSVAGSCGAP